MKRSIIGQIIPSGLDLQSGNSDIPKCESSQQFFTLGHARKKKKNNNLASSLTIDHAVSSIAKPFHTCGSIQISQQKLKFNDALTTVTDATSQGEKVISFKKTQIRQKLNRGQKLFTQKFKNSSSLNKKQPESSPHKQLRNSSKFSSVQLTNKKKKWRIQDFIIVKKIGQGSYSEVFLSVQKASNFVCSIKKIKKQTLKAQKIYDVLIRQVKIHHFLKHRSVVELYGQFDDKENIYFICQYCTQGNLHKYIQQKNKKNEQPDLLQISHIIRQICQAVQTMHRNCLMHRDIKPENVFLTIGNMVKLGDFGWSVYYGDQGLRNTQCGTPLYLAPELVRQNQYSQTVDIWAIGVLAYQLLTGQIPFKIRTAQDLSKIINQNIKFQYIQNELARDFVMRLLQRDTKLRMQIQEVLEHPFLHLQQQ